MSTEEQVSVIKNFELTPEFIINIKITDADLIARRSKQLLYPENNELYSPDLIQPAAEVDEDEEEDVEEEEEEDEMEDDADPDAIPEQVCNVPMFAPTVFFNHFMNHYLKLGILVFISQYSDSLYMSP